MCTVGRNNILLKNQSLVITFDDKFQSSSGLHTNYIFQSSSCSRPCDYYVVTVCAR